MLPTEDDVGATTSSGNLNDSAGVNSTVEINIPRPFLLYTAGTPNGRKTSIYLEELKPWYWIDYACVIFYLSLSSPKKFSYVQRWTSLLSLGHIKSISHKIRRKKIGSFL